MNFLDSRDKVVVLLGFMGSGKSTLLKPLAARLKLEELDLDAYIEQKTSLTINEIFQNYGDYYFRNLERKTLSALLRKKSLVLALGGGTPCFFDSMDLIKRNSLSVYLKVSEEQLSSRLWTERSKRPLLSDLDRASFEAYIHNELDKRRSFYERADLIVSGNNLEETIEEIVDFVEQRTK